MSLPILSLVLVLSLAVILILLVLLFLYSSIFWSSTLLSLPHFVLLHYWVSSSSVRSFLPILLFTISHSKLALKLTSILPLGECQQKYGCSAVRKACCTVFDYLNLAAVCHVPFHPFPFSLPPFLRSPLKHTCTDDI
jgi:hypothetical protein